MVEYKSVNESYVWVIDVASGERRRVLPRRRAPTAPIASADLQFLPRRQGPLPDDRSRRRIPQARVPRPRDREARLLRCRRQLGRRVDRAVARRPRARRRSPTRRASACCASTTPRRASRCRARCCQSATCSGLVWHENSRDLAVTVNGAQSPNDAYGIDVRDNVVTRWTRDARRGTRRWRVSQRRSRIEWKSFDGRAIGGFIDSPAGEIHRQAARASMRSTADRKARRDPASSAAGITSSTSWASPSSSRTCAARPATARRTSRSTTAMKREDSVKDIGALLDWIATQPDLDAGARRRRRRQLRRLHGARRGDDTTPTGSPARSTSSASPTS